MSHGDYGGSGRDEATRVYVGNLPVGVSQTDVEELFTRYGRVSRCDIKRTVSGAPFAFIEFDDPRDAKDAIEARDGYNMDGSRLRVEVPFNARSEGQRRGGRKPGGSSQRGKYKLHISGLPSTGSWQDVKDHMRKAGECGHADVFGDGTGVIEFLHRDDAEKALRMFDGSNFNSHEGEKSTISVREGFDAHGRRSSSGDRRGGGDRRGRYRSPSYDRRGGALMIDEEATPNGGTELIKIIIEAIEKREVLEETQGHKNAEAGLIHMTGDIADDVIGPAHDLENAVDTSS